MDWQSFPKGKKETKKKATIAFSWKMQPRRVGGLVGTSDGRAPSSASQEARAESTKTLPSDDRVCACTNPHGTRKALFSLVRRC